MRELQLLNWDLERGYIPECFMYCSPPNDRNNFIRRFPVGFMGLPNADLIIDKLMFYARLEYIFNRHLAKYF